VRYVVLGAVVGLLLYGVSKVSHAEDWALLLVATFGYLAGATAVEWSQADR
jgi:hypothetical protein